MFLLGITREQMVLVDQLMVDLVKIKRDSKTNQVGWIIDNL